MAETDRPEQRLLVQGQGRSMHLFSVDRQFYGGHGIVAAQVSIGPACLSQPLPQERQCEPHYFATAPPTGAGDESFNLEELWKLPVVYIVRTNATPWDTSVSRRQSAGPNFSSGGLVLHSGRAGRRHEVRAVKAAGERAVC